MIKIKATFPKETEVTLKMDGGTAEILRRLLKVADITDVGAFDDELDKVRMVRDEIVMGIEEELL